jgi:hypothetical protein
MHSNKQSDIAEDSYPDLPGGSSTTGYERDMAHSPGRAAERSVPMNLERGPVGGSRTPVLFGHISVNSSESPDLSCHIPARKCGIPVTSNRSPGKKWPLLAAERDFHAEKYRSPADLNVIPDSFSVIPGQKCRSPDVFSVIPDGKYVIPDDFSVIPDGKYVIPVINDSIFEVFRGIPDKHTLSIILSTRKKREGCSDGNYG